MSSQNLAKEQAIGTAESIAEIDWSIPEEIDRFLENVLSFEETGVRQLNGAWVSTGYTLTLGWGGPNIYLKIDSSSEATLEVYWDEKVTQYLGEMPELFDTLNQLSYA